MKKDFMELFLIAWSIVLTGLFVTSAAFAFHYKWNNTTEYVYENCTNETQYINYTDECNYTEYMQFGDHEYILPADCPECECQCPACICQCGATTTTPQEDAYEDLSEAEKYELRQEAKGLLERSNCYDLAENGFPLEEVMDDYDVSNLVQVAETNGPVHEYGDVFHAWVVTTVWWGREKITTLSSGKMIIDLDEMTVTCDGLPDYEHDWDKEFKDED